MIFTPRERRLLTLLAVLLSLGYALSALRHLGLVPEPSAVGGPDRGKVHSPAGDPNRAEPHGAAAGAHRAEPHGAGEAPPPTVRTGRAPPFRDGLLDLNAADSLDLIQLPGIGPALAGRILGLRRERGAFRRCAELLDVSGIGEKRYARLRTLVCTETDCRTQ